MINHWYQKITFRETVHSNMRKDVAYTKQGEKVLKREKER